MSKKFQTVIKGSAVALIVILTAGCATQSKETTSSLEQLAADVGRAMSAADAAAASASEARQMASGAQSTANQALNASNQAQGCCDATNEKVDRMFQKGMSK